MASPNKPTLGPEADRALTKEESIAYKLGGKAADLKAVRDARTFDNGDRAVVPKRPRLTPLQQKIYEQTHRQEKQFKSSVDGTVTATARRAKAAAPNLEPASAPALSVQPAKSPPPLTLKPPLASPKPVATQRVYPPGTPTSPQSPNVTITEVKRRPPVAKRK